jgi:glycerophosphoryl diester phosphodiesterase
MKIIAHRGASLEAPENTVPAIHLAWAEKAEGVEIDVRMTADGKVVLLHDSNTARTTGISLEIAEQTWDAIRILDAGSWKSPRYRLTPIPLLRDVLKILPPGRQLWIEIKCGPEIIPAIKRDLDLHRLPPESIGFLGFSAPLMGRVKQVFSKHPVYLNVEAPGQPGAPQPWTAETLAQLARDYSLDGVSVGMSDAIDERFIASVRAERLGLMAWVADDEHVAARLARAGLPGLMTNRPAYIRHRLRAHGVL